MEEEVIKRTPPHSVEAERSVVGSMILDRDAIVVAVESLAAEDFYQRQFGVLFDAMYQMYMDNVEVDIVTLSEKLKSMEVPPELRSPQFISGIVSSVPTSANIKYYTDIVREKAILRRLIKTSEEIATAGYMNRDSLDDILEDAEKRIFNLKQNGSAEGFEKIGSIALKALHSIEQASKNYGTVTGISTGFRDLDYKTAGLQPSDLILIAARPSMGKTAFVLNLAEYITTKEKVPTAIFSLEMSKEQLMKRLLSMNSKVDSQRIRTGNLEDEEWVKLADSVIKLGNSSLVIDDTPGISVSELRSKCRKLSMEQGLGLVIIDYLQLMSGGKRAESRQQEISEISRSLKALAREINAPVIALSQLSRAVEKRDDKRPMLSDLRESGAIEQDADVVMFIYRDEYYNKEDTKEPGVAEIIIGKQRNGPTGSVKLAWLSQYTKFGNLELDRN